MSDVFFSTLSPMLMMFACLLTGFILNKTRILPDSASAVLSRLEAYVFMPALGFSTFMKYCTISSLRENSAIFPYSIIAIVLVMLLAFPLSKLFEKNDLYKRNIYKYALVFANHGFMGNAIVPVILGGSEHLYKYLLFTLPLNFMTYLWGISILTPKKHQSKNFFKNLINAPMIGLVLGMLIGLTGTQKYMPEFIMTTVDSLQNCMGPVAMLLTGFVIGDYSFKSLLSQKKVYILTVLRLLFLPVFVLIVLVLCKANEYIVTLAFFAYATPLGLNTVVFPAAYGGDTRTGAGMAMISHVLCVVTIPAMYGLIKFVL